MQASFAHPFSPDAAAFSRTGYLYVLRFLLSRFFLLFFFIFLFSFGYGGSPAAAAAASILGAIEERGLSIDDERAASIRLTFRSSPAASAYASEIDLEI